MRRLHWVDNDGTGALMIMDGEKTVCTVGEYRERRPRDIKVTIILENGPPLELRFTDRKGARDTLHNEGLRRLEKA